MKNLTERTVTIIDPLTHSVVREFPSEGVRVTVQRDDSLPCAHALGVPVVTHAPPTGITGLDGITGSIIVPLVVAEAMRALGYKHAGFVYSPQQLVFSPGPERVALGAPGLVFHRDISSLTAGFPYSA